jgi:lipoyl(octanoyl) transferase
MNPFRDLEIPKNCESFVSNDTLIVKQWNWKYQEALEFQKEAQKFIQNNRKLKVFIFCNHPHCFTLGRGNERGVEDLITFNEADRNRLKYPVFNIHRGGGITFHYIGQWIFYPIVALGPDNSLGDLMSWVLKSVRDVIQKDFHVEKVITANKLMGVWHEKAKLASIGIGVDRFVTEHGLALNLIWDEEMFSELQKISPCGISPTTYTSLDKIIDKSDDLIEKFHHSFLERVLTR